MLILEKSRIVESMNMRTNDPSTQEEKRRCENISWARKKTKATADYII